MNDTRPDPDALLRRVQAEERKKKRGRLTIFLGAAPGVGKTFAMLTEAAYQRDVENRDVVAGVVETHRRFETATLLADFEILPKRQVQYRGTILEEFDLDAALARKPSLLLVDELAHTNAEGSRHPKRWQDVEELLDAGIEVMTTLNVQHLESLNDVVAQITGVVIRETVPDSVLDEADEVKLVDLTPDELLERLREGKVYLPAQAERAIENFFRKGNLIALRELALRRTAERVDADMQEWRKAHGIEKTWAASDRLLVCISPSPFSANLLRVGRRMAAGLCADWFAVNVETPATLQLSEAGRARIAENLRLAEQLGAITVTLTGEDAAETILQFARENNVTKIVAGKPRGRSWKDRLRAGFVDELIMGSHDIDIYVTVGDSAKLEPAVTAKRSERESKRRSWRFDEYAAGIVMTLLSTAVAFILFGRSNLPDVVMTYLLGIVLIAMRFSFAVSLVTAILSVLAYDFFFIPPYLTFTVSDFRHTITFVVMLLVAVVIAGLTQRVKDQVEVARRSESRTAVLYGMSRELARAPTRDDVIAAACGHIAAVFEACTGVFTRNGDGEIACAHGTDGFEMPAEKEMGIVRWVLANGREAGASTDTVPGAHGLYLPLVSSSANHEIIGVLGIFSKNPARFADPEQRRLADGLATQTVIALERAKFAHETHLAHLQVEAEQLRSTLLSSVSHDLRTPLAVMKGAASTLAEDDAALEASARRDLSLTILEETERLERLVRNLLDMTRLESGAVHIKKEWQSVEEVVGGALSRMESRLGRREVTSRIPAELLAPFDAALIEQVLVNLLENAAKHTPEGIPIEINAWRQGDEVVIEVADRGQGLPQAEQTRIFEKFYRAPSDKPVVGVGLGLAICQAIVTAHGGRIWAENRTVGGASFRFALPLEGEAPKENVPEVEEKPPQGETS